MHISETEIELLEKYGWIVECESPLEIRHGDGSFGTGQAAHAVIESLKSDSSNAVCLND